MTRMAWSASAWVLLASLGGTALALQITLDSGSGTVTIADNGAGDANPAPGVIDFNEAAIGGVLLAEGRVQEFTSGPISRAVVLTATPPAPEAVLRNVGAGNPIFTITIDSSSFAPFGSPLGWSIGYVAAADDALAGPVDIPTHQVAGSINGATVPLGIVAGTAIALADAIELFARGTNLGDSATDIRAVFTFAPGPDDEIRFPEDEGLTVSVFSQLNKCIDQMNLSAAKVAQAAGKSNYTCVKSAAAASSPAPCIDGLDVRADVKASQLLSKYDRLCSPVPSWGVNGGTCCSDTGAECTESLDCPGGTCAAGGCISGAAHKAADDMAHDILGPALIDGERDIARCQAKIVKAAGDVLTKRWGSLRKCKRKSLNTITSDALLVSTCLGVPQTDSSGYASKETKLGAVVAKCVDGGVTPIGATAFPGSTCASAADQDFASCLTARIACRFCLGVQVADDLDPGALDCDEFDDGDLNGSCPAAP